MAETFVITVLSFGLVLAVVASLLVWVILPALDEDKDDKKKAKLTLDDYIDQINSGNISAYSYDTLQQKAIEENSEKISDLETKVGQYHPTASGSSGSSGGAVTTATYAAANGTAGTWTIRQGEYKYTAEEKARYLCDSKNDCSTLSPRSS